VPIGKFGPGRLDLGRGGRHHRGRLRHADPGQRPERRHLVLDLGQRGEAGHRGGQPRGLDPVPGHRHDGDLLLHREQHVGPAPRGDVEGGLQPAGRVAAEAGDSASTRCPARASTVAHCRAVSPAPSLSSISMTASEFPSRTHLGHVISI
jgi:hypothetical protein